jgi:fructose-1,6-bisphosphatase
MTRSLSLDAFLAAERRRAPAITADLVALLVDLAAACRAIATVAATGARGDRLRAVATHALRSRCERGGYLAELSLDGAAGPCSLPPGTVRGALRLALAPADGAAGVELGVAPGTLFAVRRGEQLCAGYALYGPATLLVLTLGRGAHGFTLAPASGDFVCTRPDLRIPEAPRDPEPRWTGCAVADVHRVLLRGGALALELDALRDAAPLAMLVEQAGGAAATRGGRMLLGSRAAVEALLRERDERPYRSPLFGSRSLFSEG